MTGFLAKGSLRAMDQKDVFAIALGITGTPWKVVEVRLFHGGFRQALTAGFSIFPTGKRVFESCF